MNRYAFLILISLFLCSCRSSKSVSKVQSTVEALRSDTTSHSSHKKTEKKGKVTEKIEETTVIYDTSAPIDSATGKRPVVSEKRTSITRKIEEENQEVTSDTSFQVKKEEVKSYFQAEEEKEKEAPKTLPWIFLAIGAAMLILNIIFKEKWR